MKINPEDYLVVMCPPYPEYKEQPKDQSHCDLRDCPKCSDKMWLSAKKKGMLLFGATLNKNIILGCYNCIKEYAMKNPHIFVDSKKMNETLKKNGFPNEMVDIKKNPYYFCSQEIKSFTLNGVSHWMPLPNPPENK